MSDTINKMQEFKKFTSDFTAFMNLIKSLSESGEEYAQRLLDKQEMINSMSPESRELFLQNDPDFVGLNDAMKKLELYYSLAVVSYQENAKESASIFVEPSE